MVYHSLFSKRKTRGKKDNPNKHSNEHERAKAYYQAHPLRQDQVQLLEKAGIAGKDRCLAFLKQVHDNDPMVPEPGRFQKRQYFAVLGFLSVNWGSFVHYICQRAQLNDQSRDTAIFIPNWQLNFTNPQVPPGGNGYDPPPIPAFQPPRLPEPILPPRLTQTVDNYPGDLFGGDIFISEEFSCEQSTLDIMDIEDLQSNNPQDQDFFGLQN